MRGIDKKTIYELIIFTLAISPCIVITIYAVIEDFRKFIEKKEKSKDGSQ